MLPEEEERQKGLEHLHFPPHDNTALVLSRPEEVGWFWGGPPSPPPLNTLIWGVRAANEPLHRHHPPLPRAEPPPAPLKMRF